MDELKLIEPSFEYLDEYLDMITEWRSTGERMKGNATRLLAMALDKAKIEGIRKVLD